MMPLQPYRVITGSMFNPITDSFDWTAFHMTYWARDRQVLDFLIVASECPDGRIHSAYSVEAVKLPFEGEIPEPSAN